MTFKCPACSNVINAEVDTSGCALCPRCGQVVRPAAAPAEEASPTPHPPPAAPVAVTAQIPYAPALRQVKRTGLAVAAFVCGLLGLLTCVPLGIIGIILGVVALVRTYQEPDDYGGKGLAIAGICTGGLSIVILPVVMAMLMGRSMPAFLQASQQPEDAARVRDLRDVALAMARHALENNDAFPPDFEAMPALSQLREQSARAACACNLQAISIAMMNYVAQKGAFPLDFQTLIDSGLAKKRLFHCPASDARVGDLSACYVYIPVEGTSKDPGNVLVYERPECHDAKGGHVLFVNGRVEFLQPYSQVVELVGQTRQQVTRR